MPPINEAQTRKQYIDTALKRNGWKKIVPFKEGSSYQDEAVEEYPTDSGPADYVLFCDGKPLAIVEGKKVAVSPQNVLQQAQRYARTFQNSPYSFGEYKIPFVFSTNGTLILFQDLRHPLNRSREIAEFYTPSALKELLSKNEDNARAWLQQNAVYNNGLRLYQKEAVQAV